MAKSTPFMTVEFKVDRADVEYTADCIVDSLYDDYDSEVIDALGLDYLNLVNEVIDMPEFSKMVKVGIEKNGPDALDNPYDYMNLDAVMLTPEFMKVRETLDMLVDVIRDAEKNDRNLSDPCEEAIKTLQAAGFKIVKA